MTRRRIGAGLVAIGLLAAACGGGTTAKKALTANSSSTTAAAGTSSTASTAGAVAPSSSTTVRPLTAASPAPGAPKTNSPTGMTITSGPTSTSTSAAQSTTTTTSGQATSTTQAPKTATIVIQNMAFSPATLSIPVGTKVTVINKDSTTHDWTADDGTFNSGNLAPNQSYSFTFTKAGTFPYHCAIHPYMTGTVQVS